MAIITVQELIDMVIMVLGVGFIFSNLIRVPTRREKTYDPLKEIESGGSSRMHDFWTAVMISAPGVVFHEVAHKMAGILLGLNAVFHAHYAFLLLGALLSVMKFPFIFFVPGYVTISGYAQPLYYAIVALAGPLLNLSLWLGSWGALKAHLVPRKYLGVVAITAQINMFLFIFNMLPIPGFDGFSVYSNLYKQFF
jgi:Zn-dependent protease